MFSTPLSKNKLKFIAANQNRATCRRRSARARRSKTLPRRTRPNRTRRSRWTSRAVRPLARPQQPLKAAPCVARARISSTSRTVSQSLEPSVKVVIRKPTSLLIVKIQKPS